MSDQLANNVTADQLRRAAQIKDRIEELEAQLAAMLGGTSTPVTGKRRGRPPGSSAAAPKAKKKRKMSAEGRARIIEAQRKRWAAVKKKKKGK